MMSSCHTHQLTNPHLCGVPVALAAGFCRAALTTTDEMAVDRHGLIHGGFVFGLADYAAMLAVNHPNVALGAAEVKFLKPVKTGDALVAEAFLDPGDGKKRRVQVSVTRGEDTVFEGTFICFILERHVLS